MFPGSSCHTQTKTDGNVIMGGSWWAVQGPLQYCEKKIRIIIIIIIFGSKSNKIRFRSQNYMGASFQAPRAIPGQRQMEMHQDSLITIFYISVCFFNKIT